jgi:hypothetical protein
MSRRLVSLEGLLMRPRPELGESWPGYLCRLADRNALPGVAGLVRVLNVSKGALLCGQLASEQTDFALDVPDPSKGALIATLVVGRSWRTRICPICVDGEDPIVQARWDGPLTLRCTQHRCMLIDRCDSCHTPIRHDRQTLDSCACGKRFRTMVPKVVPSWVTALESAYAEAISPNVGLVEASLIERQHFAARGAWYFSQFGDRSGRIGQGRASAYFAMMVLSDDFDTLAKAFDQHEVGFSKAFEEWFEDASASESHHILVKWRLNEFEKIQRELDRLRSRAAARSGKARTQFKSPLRSRPSPPHDRHLWGVEPPMGSRIQRPLFAPQDVRSAWVPYWKRAIEPLRMCALSRLMPTQSELQLVTSVAEAATLLGVSRPTVRRMAALRILIVPNRMQSSNFVTVEGLRQLVLMLDRCRVVDDGLHTDSEGDLASCLDELASPGKGGQCESFLRSIATGRIAVHATCPSPQSLRDYQVRR